MTPAIAIVGIGCRYPDAKSPAELWENVLAQRRAFRRLPSERLNAADYYSADANAPDRTYSMTAAVLEDYEFDRVRFKVSGSAYRSADLAHWLALDVAAQALADAGFADGAGLPRENTAVYLGNTLTGEFSRAATLRLRWPFVRRVVASALARHETAGRADLLREIEAAYKRPFAEVGEETLAGGLSNTIAGRISNHFDLHGGGYTVDGACASSLLATATACSALAAGDCDVALAGGVDLSLDPFELVGFAKTGALAHERMRVYDVRSGGFWPGEGCGFAVMMRHDDALASGRRIYALLRGWGISSDGSGGITRPETEGQLLALRRAYSRAGFGPDSVAYFEGHGTGTAVGDATELRVIARARAEAGASEPAAISSIKAIIGHTKAAAGIAGLIKASLAIHAQVRPPATGCESPHPEMGPAVVALTRPESWPTELPLRAAVSAMGFGGINCHIVLEGAAAARRQALSARERTLAATPQDAELFLFRSTRQVERVRKLAADLSWAEMADLAATLAQDADTDGGRAAVVAATPEELARKVEGLTLRAPLGGGPRIGFLLPGQGSQNAAAATELAQPAIVRDSLAALRELSALGIEASVAVGHSLGELTALCWAGALGEQEVVRIAAERGRLMAAIEGPAGAMAGIGAGEEETRRLFEGEPATIAGLNSRSQTVVSGPADAVGRVVARAQAAGLRATLLNVSHAFHSPLMEPVAEPFAEFLEWQEFRPLRRRVLSTISGGALEPHADVRELLRRQLTEPVRFREALETAEGVDLWIEAGPGRVLSMLAAETVKATVLPVESGRGSRRRLLEAVGAAFEMGAPVRTEALFSGRFVRPFRGPHKFLANPCESAPAVDEDAPAPVMVAPELAAAASAAAGESPLAVVRRLVSEHSELPPAAIADDARLLADLHLNSIVVAQIASEAARRLGIQAPSAPLEYAGLSVAEIARSLEASAAAPRGEATAVPPGVDTWVRPFVTKLVPRLLPPAPKEAALPREWRFFGAAAAFEAAADAFPAGGGLLVCVPPVADESCAGMLLEAARAAIRLQRPARFVMVQSHGGAAGLARTLYLEARDLPVCVVDLPAGDPAAVERVIAEAASARGYREVHYDAAGVRYEPALSVAQPPLREFPLGPQDVLLVSGGGKGIGAECAIEAARAGGSRLAILGSSTPEESPELAANLERMRALGVPVHYACADVTDRDAVRAALVQVQQALGPVTAILHCAGINRPRSIEAQEEAGFQRTVRVKTAGLANLLAEIDAKHLKLAVAFGSIIGRIGMLGEADYAVANEWLARDLERWGAAHPQCRCLTLEWSVWSGAGMGERIARLEEMRRAGVSPITIDEGLRAFREALCYDLPEPATLVMTGRFGPPPTVEFEAPELPLLRFLDRVRVHYPGVELVAEADLSVESDPYLEDHIFSGARLFAGVMALEAMAQAAMAVTGSAEPPAFEQTRFHRPIIVPGEGALAIRVAALVRGEGEVEVCLRSAETGFQTDHFRAICRFGGMAADTSFEAAEAGEVAIDPARDLYGGLLFQAGRFRRLRSYRRLAATECVAEAAAAEPQGWFNRYLPQTLALGDPGIRDAAIHAIQPCIPHARVLPAGVAAIAFRPHAVPEWYRIRARERCRAGDLLVYDLEISTPAGEVVEQWRGLELRIVGAADAPAEWPPALLVPYLERRVAEAVGHNGFAVELGVNGRSAPTRRADGKPLAHSGHMARSHAGSLTFTVTSEGEVGCDCEPVTPRAAAVWRDLLGAGGFALAELVARESPEKLEHAATRVWCALESMKKAGARQDLGLVLSNPEESAAASAGWVVLCAGDARIATWIAPVAGFREPLAFAVLVASS